MANSLFKQLRRLLQISNTSLGSIGLDPYAHFVRHYPQRRLSQALHAERSNLRHGGVSVILDLTTALSIPQVGRDFIMKLTRTDIPFSILDVRPPFVGDPTIPIEESQHFKHLAPNGTCFSFLLQFAQGDKAILNDRHPVIFTPFFEFETGLAESCPHLFDGKRGAIVFSEFCKKVITPLVPFDRRSPCPSDVSKGECPVVLMPYPINIAPTIESRSVVRRRFAISDDAFAVFYNFDMRSDLGRKNPEGVIAAFADAFSAEPHACLVLKVGGGEAATSRIRSMLDYSHLRQTRDRVIIIQKIMSHDEVLSLTAACDAYISLHRGEGLGLGMLEAMTVGLPVIATAYGGNTDFCTANTSFLIPYHMENARLEIQPYRFVKKWAEPNVREAARILRRIFDNPSLGKAKAIAARSFVTDKYSNENFSASLKAAMAIFDEQSAG